MSLWFYAFMVFIESPSWAARSLYYKANKSGQANGTFVVAVRGTTTIRTTCACRIATTTTTTTTILVFVVFVEFLNRYFNQRSRCLIFKEVRTVPCCPEGIYRPVPGCKNSRIKTVSCRLVGNERWHEALKIEYFCHSSVFALAIASQAGIQCVDPTISWQDR